MFNVSLMFDIWGRSTQMLDQHKRSQAKFGEASHEAVDLVMTLDSKLVFLSLTHLFIPIFFMFLDICDINPWMFLDIMEFHQRFFCIPPNSTKLSSFLVVFLWGCDHFLNVL